MKYISLANGKVRELPFYLAMEEYVAKFLDLDEAFFMWQVAPTVIFGRNQLIEKEINLSYCKDTEIQMYRRKSGGGCVYSDCGNIMFSYVTKEYNVNTAYFQYLDKVVSALRYLGVNAESTGRNDIVIDGRKIAGNAFYHVAGKSVVHGTMLFDTDMDNMVNAITPATVKLQSNGIDSVRSRIALLKDYLNMSIDEFKENMKKQLCDNVLVLDDNAVVEIERLEQIYLDDNFIYGKNPRCNIVKEQRLEGVGTIKAMIETEKGLIRHVNLIGDYFLNEELDGQLLERLENIPYREDAIRTVLADIEVGNIIRNLNNEQLIKLIII